MMSQTETLLLVVLGFAVATLLALFIGRFAWNLALRLGARRMQRQVPSTVAELQSERDRLRAEYAMQSRSLGSRLEAIKAKMAEQMAEVTRHRNRIELMLEDVAGRDAEIATLRTTIDGLEQELGQRKASEAALQAEVAALAATAADRESMMAALQAVLAERDGNISALTAALAERDDGIAALRSTIGEAEAKITAIDGELDLATRDGGGAEDRLKQRIGQLTDLSRQIAANRQRLTAPAALPPPPETAATLDQKLAEAERESDELQKELARLDQAWTAKLSELERIRAGSSGESPANVIPLGNRIRQQP